MRQGSGRSSACWTKGHMENSGLCSGRLAMQTLALFLIIALPCFAEAPQDANSFLNAGNGKLAQGNYKGAALDYSRALTLNRRMWQAYFGRAMCFVYLKEYGKALTDCNRTIQLNPTFARTYVQRAYARIGKNDLKAALKDATKALELDGNLLEGYSVRASVRGKSGDRAGAIADYDEYIRRSPKTAWPYTIRGYHWVKRGDYDTAEPDFRKAVELLKNPVRAGEYHLRGTAKHWLHDFDGAIGDFTRAIELDSRDPEFIHNRGASKLMKGDLDGALVDVKKVLSMRSWKSRPQTFAIRSHINYVQGNWREALSDCVKGIGSKDNDRLQWNAWVLRMKLDKKADADRELRKYLKKRKPDPDDGWRLKIPSFLLGELDEKAFLEATSSLKPWATKVRGCQAHYYVGVRHLFANEPDKAKASFARCAESGSKHSWTYHFAAAELSLLDKME